MKFRVFILIFGLFVLKMKSQGSSVYENKVFETIEKSAIANKHKIKSINYYSEYVDSLNKGRCTKREVYDSKGRFVKEIIDPNSGKAYQERKFIYNEKDLLKEVRYVYRKETEPYKVIHMNYNSFGQIEAMWVNYTASKSIPDTLLYYYNDEGRCDYKVWAKRKSAKKSLHYNSCGQISYFEATMIDLESVEVDSNNCLIYYEFIDDDPLVEKSLSRYTYDSHCQILTEYTQYNFGKEWRISTDTSEYDMDSKLIHSTHYKCEARTKEKCIKKFSLYLNVDYIYNEKGLSVLDKVYGPKNKLKRAYYREYEYFE